MLARRRDLAPETREVAGKRVAEVLGGSAEFAAAARVVMYAALEFEVPTAFVAAAATAAGKQLLWPRVIAEREIEVVPSQQHADFVRDAAGVLAPRVSIRAVRITRGDLILVPGVAFTREGARLGRGGGHYDRLLASAAAAVSIGLAFDIQLVDEIPMEPHDRFVDGLVTPCGMWRATR